MNNMKYVALNPPVLTIAIDGDFKFNICTAVANEIQTAYQNGCTKCVVDFANTRLIDSAALLQLTKVRRHVRPENFSAKNARGLVLSALRSYGFDSWLLQ